MWTWVRSSSRDNDIEGLGKEAGSLRVYVCLRTDVPFFSEPRIIVLDAHNTRKENQGNIEASACRAGSEYPSVTWHQEG